MTIALEDIFSEDGILSRAIPGFRLREQQLEMAQAVMLAIENASILIAEAEIPQRAPVLRHHARRLGAHLLRDRAEHPLALR